MLTLLSSAAARCGPYTASAPRLPVSEMILPPRNSQTPRFSSDRQLSVRKALNAYKPTLHICFKKHQKNTSVVSLQPDNLRTAVLPLYYSSVSCKSQAPIRETFAAGEWYTSRFHPASSCERPGKALRCRHFLMQFLYSFSAGSTPAERIQDKPVWISWMFQPRNRRPSVKRNLSATRNYTAHNYPPPRRYSVLRQP